MESDQNLVKATLQEKLGQEEESKGEGLEKVQKVNHNQSVDQQEGQKQFHGQKGWRKLSKESTGQGESAGQQFQQLPKHITDPEPQRMSTSALSFKVLKQWNRCRASTLTLPHGEVRTPVYMPVGTKGGMKGITSQSMAELIDCDIMLANTYHLFLTPGEEVLLDQGGLHRFSNWNRNLLTDSGGFQIVSLGDLNEITEEGVSFKSHIDGQQFKLTPERSMEIQNAIGADIMMALDDVVCTTTRGPRVDEAMERSVRWLDRCIQAHKRQDEQNLFAIIQGGVDLELRKRCCEMMVARNTPGYAIGGLVGGEDKQDFWKTVKVCTDLLPQDKPRYVMGVGYAEDLMVCSLLGADMFDCVFATRTARFGSAFTKYGFQKVRSSKFENDFGPISEGCECYTCKNYTRSYICNLFKKDDSCLQLISIHNVHFLVHLLRGLRQAVLEDRAQEYSRDFFRNYYRDAKDGIPQWIQDACEVAGVKL